MNWIATKFALPKEDFPVLICFYDERSERHKITCGRYLNKTARSWYDELEGSHLKEEQVNAWMPFPDFPRG